MNHIGIYDNSISEGLIDDLLSALTIYNQHVEEGTVSTAATSNVVKDVKESFDLCSVHMDDDLVHRYHTELQASLEKYLSEYTFAAVVDRFAITEYWNIQHYPPGGGFKQWHCEMTGMAVPDAFRHLVFMTYLSTVEDKDNTGEGGTEFFYQDLKVNAVKGRTVIWPAYWTHTHKGIVSPTQEKTIVTGWYSYITQQ